MNEQTAAKIQAERERQREKWGENQFAGLSPETILAVLTEEVGEVAEAVLHLRFPPPIHENARRRRWEELEAEIVQVAAVAAAWLDECFTKEQTS